MVHFTATIDSKLGSATFRVSCLFPTIAVLCGKGNTPETDGKIHFKSTVKLHKRGPLLQTAGHPFSLLLGQPSSDLLPTAQAGGPPSVKIGWAT